MDDFGFSLKRTILLTAISGGALSIALALLGKIGMIIGMIAGCVTFIAYYGLLTWQMRRGAAMPKEQALQYLQSGWIARFSLVIGTALVCTQVTAVHIGALLAGFYLPFRFVVFINAIALLRRTFLADTKIEIRPEPIPLSGLAYGPVSKMKTYHKEGMLWIKS